MFWVWQRDRFYPVYFGGRGLGKAGEELLRNSGDIMIKFEYEVTKHAADEFNHLVYFCTETGECDYAQLPADQMEVLKDILNEKGSQGWELIQLIFGKDGVVAFWKRPT